MIAIALGLFTPNSLLDFILPYSFFLNHTKLFFNLLGFFMIDALLNVHWCNISMNGGCKVLKKGFPRTKRGILEAWLPINSSYGSE